MTNSTQQVCIWAQVAVPHTMPPPASVPIPASAADASEPLAEASVPPPLDPPLLDVLPLVVPLLDVVPELVPLPDVEPPEVPLLDVLPLDVPLLEVEAPPEVLPPFAPLEPPLELLAPPSPPPMPTVEPAPLHATNPNTLPTKATTGSRIIVSSSRASETPHKAWPPSGLPSNKWGGEQHSLRPTRPRRNKGTSRV